jgi:hypothetical protein
MSEPVETTPIEDLWDKTAGFKSPDARQAIAEAEIIVGVDTISGRHFIVYGRDAAKNFAANDVGPPPMLAVSLTRDFGSHDLEKLLAMVRAVKGRDDYKPLSVIATDRTMFQASPATCSTRK